MLLTGSGPHSAPPSSAAAAAAAAAVAAWVLGIVALPLPLCEGSTCLPHLLSHALYLPLYHSHTCAYIYLPEQAN